ncbi:MAG: sugar ABC transporter permease [Actinomycetes bacterium]
MATARSSLRKSRFGALPWIGPAVTMIAVMVLWPAIEMIRTSFQNVDQTGFTKGWNGVANYRSLIHNPDLPGVLSRTLVWVTVVVIATVLISLPVAQLLNAKFPGRKLVRYAIIVPWAASVVMTSTSWKWILDGYYGVLNKVLQDFGLIKEPIDWLGNPNQAFIWLMVVAVFVSVPFTSYVILAGLTTVPGDILEAATVDGADGFQRYRTIIFPLLRPALLVSMVINLINVFNSFPIIWVMTTGGPGYLTDTTTTLAYKISFRDQDIGQSASMATVNFCIVLVFIVVFLKVSKWRETSE